MCAAAIGLHWAVYLCYRDLEPGGLWRFFNVHYFKWSFPLLLVAALRLATAVLQARERRAAFFAITAAAPLFFWQAHFVAARAWQPRVAADGSFPMEADLSSVRHAVQLPLAGAHDAIYSGEARLSAADASFGNVSGFKLFPVPGGALLLPLRPLPGSGLVFHPAPGTALAAGKSVADGVVRLRIGVPCRWRFAAGQCGG